MAYNVFKRPMFKRGGSTTGTGIMSHVEPRRNYNMGGFPSFGITQMPPQSQIDKFKQAEIDRQLRKREPSIFAGDRFSMPENFPGGFPEYRKFLEQQKQEQKELQSAIESPGSGIATIEPGQSAFDAVFAPVSEELAKQQEEKKKLLEKKEVIKVEPAYEGTDIKSEVENESKMIRELLKDEQYSKGELALLVAGALKEPGGIAEKLDKARELALPVARKRREEDKAITLAAYKLAKEKEQQQIKAGTSPKELRILRAGAEAEAKRTGGDAEEIYQERLAKFGGLDETTQRSINSLLQGRGEVQRLVNDIKGARKRKQEAASSGKDTSKIDTELEQYMSEFDTIKNSLGFEFAYPELVGFKEGGRVNRAMGSDEDGETSDIISSQVSFTPETTTKDSMKNETVVEKPVENLTFAELRDRLPPEITDDVVQMLSSSEEALQDFAYIRTQDDVNQFNVKYGVSLVIPPTQA
ncbi:hypothetical protein ACFL3Q_09440 [Planctomycetota bacterium]